MTAAEAAFWKWRAREARSRSPSGTRDHTEPQALTIVGVYEQVPDDAYWMRAEAGRPLRRHDRRRRHPRPRLLDHRGRHVHRRVGSGPTDDAVPAATAKLITLDDVPAAAAAIAAGSSRLRVRRGGQPHDRAAGRHPRRPEAGAARRPAADGPARPARGGRAALGGRRGRRAAPPRGGPGPPARPQPRRRPVARGGRARPHRRARPAARPGARRAASTRAARRLLLPEGVPFEFPLSVLLALVAAAVVGLCAVWLAAQPVLSEPISSLLRRVAQARASRRLPVVDIVVVALAVAGLAGLATSSEAGPLALMTPTLLSLAAGLVVAHLVVRAADSSGRSARAARSRGTGARGLPARPPAGSAQGPDHHHRGHRPRRLRGQRRRRSPTATARPGRSWRPVPR